MNNRTLHDKLSTNLSILKNKIEIENATNNLSLNILLETTFLKIFNLVFNYNCENTNKFKSTFSAIDGADLENKIMVQITSTFSFEKIESTVRKVIENRYYTDYNTLYFLFLKDRNSLKKESKEKLFNIIDGKFSLDMDNGFVGISDIYRLLTVENNYSKITEVNDLLESIFLDMNFPQATNFVALSFDVEEVQNAYLVVQVLNELNYKVVVGSKKVYDSLLAYNSKNLDCLVIFNENIGHHKIKKYILIVSNNYIKSNIDSKQPNCSIFSFFNSQGVRPLLLKFDEFSDNITNKNYKNPRSVNCKNTQKIEFVIKEYFKPANVLKYNFYIIKQVIKSLFPTHSFRQVAEEKYFCVYNLSYKNSVINFLILSHDFKRNEVVKYFEENFLRKHSNNLTILVPKDYNQSTDLRLNYFKTRYKNKYEVHYLDEFLFEESLKNTKQEPFFTDEVFVSPFFKIDNDYEKLDDIFDWLKNDETSVAFIIGSGGDGKTTVCQKIHDVIINEFDNNIVIFLDAQSYIEQIKQRERIDNWKFDLQTVFEISNTEVGELDINIFKSNFVFGNITVIIDGIDEVISTLPNFNLADFLADFISLEETIGKGKLIINCRDIYINELLGQDSDFQNKHKIFNLLKFNRDLVEKYFKKDFNNDLKKVNDSIKLLDYFYDHIKNDEYIYSPFLLEIISNIVKNDFDYEEIEPYYDSEILIKKNNNDYLIYKICKREIAKKENHGFTIGVDDYVRLLGLIAVEKNGVFTDDDFSFLLKKLSIDLNSDKVKNSLKDNPFFQIKNSEYHFRFDFYRLFFKNNALYSKLINIDSFTLTDTFITVLSKELKYNSLLYEGLKNKINDSSYDFNSLILKFKKIITEIENFHKGRTNLGHDYIKQLAISNIFIFLNDLKSKDYSTTDVLLKLFSDENFGDKTLLSVNNLYLIEISESLKLTIDLSNIYFTNTVVENYGGFLNCIFNDNTFFDHTCKISNIQSDKIDLKKFSANKSNFDDFITSNDNTLYVALNLAKFGGESILSYLRKYFRSFLKGGRLMDTININKLPKSTLYITGLDELNSLLLKNSILKSVDNIELTINNLLKSKILKFVNQNVTFSELNKTIKELQNKELNGN